MKRSRIEVVWGATVPTGNYANQKVEVRLEAMADDGAAGGLEGALLLIEAQTLVDRAINAIQLGEKYPYQNKVFPDDK